MNHNKKTIQMRFNPKAIGIELSKPCKYCGCMTGPEGVCGFCKILREEWDLEEDE